MPISLAFFAPISPVSQGFASSPKYITTCRGITFITSQVLVFSKGKGQYFKTKMKQRFLKPWTLNKKNSPYFSHFRILKNLGLTLVFTTSWSQDFLR